METQPSTTTTPTKVHVHSKIDICIQDCLDCYKMCEQSLAECLSKGGKLVQSSHLILLKSCAEICHTNAKFMMMQSKYHPRTSDITADVCNDCAISCDSIGDESMKQVAAICRKCSESCKELSKHFH